MTPLAEIIRKQIESNGPMTVAEYMSICLGHPAYGYYMTRDPLGRGGDFITSPEISQIFGELIGFWLAQSWVDRGEPEICHLVECGPGRGTFMADILRASSMLPGFQKALRVHLVETSPTLKEAQLQNLADYQINCHNDLMSLPAAHPDQPTFFVANEFFDALPIHQLIRTEEGWHERCIGWDDKKERFIWCYRPKPSNFNNLLSEDVLRVGEPGDIAESSTVSRAVAAIMGKRIADTNGVGLFIDYGYGKSSIGDSFQAMKDHKFCDCLDHCGEADLTAHVDFQAIAEEFKTFNCRTAPLLEQGEFLKRLGIELRTRQLLKNATEAQQQQILSGTDRLINPEEMGSLFKVLAVAAKNSPLLAGFEIEEPQK